MQSSKKFGEAVRPSSRCCDENFCQKCLQKRNIALMLSFLPWPEKVWALVAVASVSSNVEMAAPVHARTSHHPSALYSVHRCRTRAPSAAWVAPRPVAFRAALSVSLSPPVHRPRQYRKRRRRRTRDAATARWIIAAARSAVSPRHRNKTGRGAETSLVVVRPGIGCQHRVNGCRARAANCARMTRDDSVPLFPRQHAHLSSFRHLREK